MEKENRVKSDDRMSSMKVESKIIENVKRNYNKKLEESRE